MTKKQTTSCESCANYTYDDLMDYYVCERDLDEDEMVRFLRADCGACPYYQFGDEYRIVRKQM